MKSQLDRLWPLLGREWPLRWARQDLATEIRTDALAWAEATGVARCSVLDGSTYACGGIRPRCLGRDIFRVNGVFALCSQTPEACAAVSFVDPHQAVVDDDTLVPFLQGSLGLLRQRADPVCGIVPLGSRLLGNRSIQFVLAPRPRDPLTRAWLAQATLDPRQSIAAIAFDRQLHRAELPNPRFEWMFLSDGLPTPDGLVLDLADVLERFVPNGIDGGLLWPRYRFVVNELTAQVWFAGRELDITKVEVLRLLLALLRHPNERMSLESLLTLVYPKLTRPSESSLRKVKAALVDLLEAVVKAVAVEGLTTPLDRENDGHGYVLKVPFGGVRWLRPTSRTSADLPADLQVR
ncbi:MAG: hypothetical protein ABMB14_06820 [Myxococcota bacterium]